MSAKIISPTYFKAIEIVPRGVCLYRIHRGYISTLVLFWSRFPHWRVLSFYKGPKLSSWPKGKEMVPGLWLGPLQARMATA